MSYFFMDDMDVMDDLQEFSLVDDTFMYMFTFNPLPCIVGSISVSRKIRICLCCKLISASCAVIAGKKPLAEKQYMKSRRNQNRIVEQSYCMSKQQKKEQYKLLLKTSLNQKEAPNIR